jgi:putative membrane protein
MSVPAFLAFLHHLAAFTLFGALMVELVLLKSELTATSVRSLLRMDAAYGISAAVLFAVGFLRVFYAEKGANYYFHSVPFLAKITLFFTVGLLSIYPTRRFLKWRKSPSAAQVIQLGEGERRKLRTIIHTELTLLMLLILCAALMARGIGYFG